jgi:hypothetical protein
MKRLQKAVEMFIVTCIGVSFATLSCGMLTCLLVRIAEEFFGSAFRGVTWP